MNIQTKTFMENTTFQQEKDKSIDLLLKMRETSVLVEISNLCKDKQIEMDCINISEFDYCELKGRTNALQEIIDYCKEKIQTIKNQ